MADQIEDALIREVNDDLREEQMKKLWKRYGGYVIGVAVLIVAIVAGYQGWKQYDLSSRQAEGDSFYGAQTLAKSGDIDGAIAAFATLSNESQRGYGVLSQFQHAALLASKNDIAAAAEVYTTIARENVGDVALSGLANVLGAMVEINAGGYDGAAITLRLKAISSDGHPYRYSARELLALVAMQAGDKTSAHDQFKALADDVTAPGGIRARAKSLVQYVGG